MSGTRAKVSTSEQRMKWLVDHPELWKDVKLVAIAGGEYKLFVTAEDHRRIARAMQDAGLFAPSTNWVDIRVDRYIRMVRSIVNPKARKRA